MARAPSYRVYLSQFSSSSWHELHCGFIPKLVMKQYDIPYLLIEDSPAMMMKLAKGKCTSWSWVIQNIETGDIFTDALSFCVDVKQTQILPL